MSLWPKINIRRTFLIARRDYLGYVKTWGFWISFILPFLFGAFGFFMATADIDLSPTQYVAILDETGEHSEGLKRIYEDRREDAARDALSLRSIFIRDERQKEEFDLILKTEGSKAALNYLTENVPSASREFTPPEPEFLLTPAPEKTLESLLPYLKGEKLMQIDGQDQALGGLIIFKTGASPSQPETQYWSTNINKRDAPNIVNRYLEQLARTDYLDTKGLSVTELDRRVDLAPKTNLFDPLKTETTDQGVDSSDTIPYLVSVILAFMLWLTVFSGAYMLLTSMLEEKLNKLLEMMLASTRFSEIILGKMLGVAALTLSMMAPYIIVGVLAVIGLILFGPNQDVASGLISAFDAKMIIFLIIYLILGYILYGAFFIALGSLSSSMQDAQTLTTPILFILMGCAAIIPLGLSAPDSPLLRIATFIPFSAPFASIVRLPSDPPLWELLLSTAILFLLCLGTITMAGRVFRFGVLSGAGAGAVVSWFKRVILRRKA